ncbi:DNA helicase [Xenorhabdus bovienii]|uniref:AAA domain-containing protein n=1 Tax=Xenorhabdus bovienii TaxID=40576 RepID=UPI0023B2B5F6|nr:AAA domain-containing protein [Xenorhabdus bovienii]MDE9436256.1 DNA helicase [Xenorhabdus bovienii]MDE9498348.1 DNA helicase [Xenorhabdus bovienii]
MDGDSLAFARYWRNSLADAEFGQGTFKKSDMNSFQFWPSNEIKSGRLSDATLAALFDGEPQEVDIIEVVLRPYVYQLLVQHGKERLAGLAGTITPIVTSAILARDGHLYPSVMTTIPRDLLEPLPKGTFSLGSVAEYDRYKTLKSTTTISYPQEDVANESEEQREERAVRFLKDWMQYLKDCDALLKAVAGEWLQSPGEYLRTEEGFIQKKASLDGAGQHILALYDHFLSSKASSPLFTRFASQQNPPLKPLLPSSSRFTERLAHSGDQFPLADAQRDALNHFLEMEEGDILAVNGPPGTGKTTLLLSIIATLWTRAALDKAEPPIVIATSTNNQAVTNIIEAFGKDFSIGNGTMAGRWLPEMKSFGAYFPSSTREDEARKKDFQIETFFDAKETLDYVEKAEREFLNKAQAAFPTEEQYTVAKVVELLHQELHRQAGELSNMEFAWQRLYVAREQCLKIAENIDSYLEDMEANCANEEEIYRKLSEMQKGWDDFVAKESLIYPLFSWLPPIKAKRYSSIRTFFRGYSENISSQISWSEPSEITKRIETAMASVQKRAGECAAPLNKVRTLVEERNVAQRDWANALLSVGHCNKDELTFAEADALADKTIRFALFQLATHYWEGRWLLDMHKLNEIDRKKCQGGKAIGKKLSISRWHRRMKLTPCVVMTNYMLPKKMLVKQFASQDTFNNDYLYNAADLLIVDEAGQVLPEVAGASFSLAKKSLVIGDTKQIAPIWNVTPTIDIGNVLSQKILLEQSQDQLHEDYEIFSQSGRSAASGSVMSIAQNTSRYHYDPDMPRGMYLYEHRRCFNNIIGYCNELCYDGKLIPKRGHGVDNLYPAMGYLHVDGKGVKANGGSRYNLLEAETIAEWIVDQRQHIEAKYERPIYDVVAVVTPFGEQATVLRRAMDKRGIYSFEEGDSKNILTVGTVHSLQGAERPIVIFSPVYSKHEDGSFIDSDPSKLNVAVSRAKDSFLVFGDMDLFELQPRSTPRGLLAHYLFSDAQNALSFAYKKRPDLALSGVQIKSLHGPEQHDEFLRSVFEQVTKKIMIVSPWISLKRMEQTGFLSSMAEARQRGINIVVVTDKDFNTGHRDGEIEQERKLKLSEALVHLQSSGIETRLVNRVHSKIVIGDDNLLCVGSFNWFSASRDDWNTRYDTSLIYRGKNLNAEIDIIKSCLQQRLLQS